MRFFKTRYFGAKYNIPFTLPPDEVIIPEVIGGGAWGHTEYEQKNDEEKRIRERINRDDNEFMFLLKILIEQCQ